MAISEYGRDHDKDEAAKAAIDIAYTAFYIFVSAERWRTIDSLVVVESLPNAKAVIIRIATHQIVSCRIFCVNEKLRRKEIKTVNFSF